MRVCPYCGGAVIETRVAERAHQAEEDRAGEWVRSVCGACDRNLGYRAAGKVERQWNEPATFWEE